MITGGIKSKIDQIWNSFWSGGISNPLEVMEQMTYLLFIRRLDEIQITKEKKANRLKTAVEKPIFTPEQDHLRWSKFITLGDPTQLYDTIANEDFPFIKSIGNEDDTTYSHHMKDARFTIPNAALLTKVVDLLAEVPMDDKDTKGDIYEYMLGKIASAGQNGQFRTPRHIIKMIVELMQPKPTDTICDPACGTAGFLVAASEYLNQHHSTEIFANPPFAGSLDYESCAKNIQAIVKTKKTELLFLALFLRILKTGGRAAIIVPDGVLFGSSKAHKDLRQKIVEEQKLEAIISMPSGVFKPYAGVSTAIMIFTKTMSGGTDKVWFYDMQADGYSLDDKRNELDSSKHDNNNIPDIIARFKNLEAESTRKATEQSFMVDKADIAANGYDLSINRYKEVVYEQVEYEAPSKILADLEVLEQDILKGMAALKEMLK